jgi:hypothetical protein
MENPLNRYVLAETQKNAIDNGILSRIHHAFNMSFGYVSMDELRRMPMYAMLTMLGYIENDMKTNKKQMSSSGSMGSGIRGLKKRV